MLDGNNGQPNRFRFIVLEASTNNNPIDGNSKPLANAICKNCKQQNYLVSRPLVDPPHVFFCTHCGGLTANRAVRRSRGLMAPTIQTAGQTGIAQPAFPNRHRQKARGIHTHLPTDVPGPDTFLSPLQKVVDVSETSST